MKDCCQVLNGFLKLEIGERAHKKTLVFKLLACESEGVIAYRSFRVSWWTSRIIMKSCYVWLWQVSSIRVHFSLFHFES